MRVNAGILIIIIGLLFLVGTVGAEIQVNVNGNSSWLVAGSGSSAAYTVTVTNTTPTPNVLISGATITFSGYENYGSMSPTSVITINGQAATTFTVGTKSGTAPINYHISYPGVSGGEGPFTLDGMIPQNIDHGILIPKFTPASGTVGTVNPFNVSITDQWGNPIDNRRSESQLISLYVTCPLPNDCSFVGYGQSFSASPDSNGNVTIPLQFGTKTGFTTIVMSPIKDLVKDIDEQTVYINTITSNFFTLTAEVSPASGVVPVNTGVFYFRYTLIDKFGNPVGNQLIRINTSLNEQFFTTTTATGITPIQNYGPKVNVFSNIIITASAVNTSALTQFNVSFANSTPSDMVLSVSPQTMTSLEVDPTSRADVIARVVDNFGNPVKGENITFTLVNKTTPNPNWTANPYLSYTGMIYPTSYTGTTDTDGNVRITFIPGKLNVTPDKLDGSSVLTAKWASKPLYPDKSVDLTWMNYPYLSIFTSVSNQTVLLNDTVDVTIRLVGNGQKYLPITVMLDQDTSSSMKNPSDTAGLTREQAASNAAIVFMGLMEKSNTQMGLETFGKDQTSGITGHIKVDPLNTIDNSPYPGDTHFDYIKYNLENLVGLGPSKEMEKSIDTSINNINNETKPGSAHAGDIKALIVLSDGGSNLDNHGTLTTLINKAKASPTSPIYIFTVSYLNGVGGETSSQAFGEMEELANKTGGKHYWNKSLQGLVDIYEDIAKEIQILAGTNTTMNISFQNIIINSTYTMAGHDVYDYVPVPPFGNYSSVQYPNGRTSIIWTNGSQSVVNQSDDWAQSKLSFDIGTIEVGKEWSTTFRLRVKTLGLIKIFGSGSAISFTGGGTGLTLPDLFINVKSNLTEEGFKTGTLDIKDENTVPPSGTFIDFIPIGWNTNYTHTVDTNFATEYVYYRVNGGPWIQFDQKSGISSGDSHQSAMLDVRSKPSGLYTIWILAKAVDADDDNGYIYDIKMGRTDQYFIILK